MVNDIKIIQGKDGLFISMPSRRKKNGRFKDVAHPLNNDTRKMIEDRILLARYESDAAGRGDANVTEGPGGQAGPIRRTTCESPKATQPPASPAETGAWRK